MAMEWWSCCHIDNHMTGFLKHNVFKLQVVCQHKSFFSYVNWLTLWNPPPPPPHSHSNTHVSYSVKYFESSLANFFNVAAWIRLCGSSDMNPRAWMRWLGSANLDPLILIRYSGSILDQGVWIHWTGSARAGLSGSTVSASLDPLASADLDALVWILWSKSNDVGLPVYRSACRNL